MRKPCTVTCPMVQPPVQTSALGRGVFCTSSSGHWSICRCRWFSEPSLRSRSSLLRVRGPMSLERLPWGSTGVPRSCYALAHSSKPLLPRGDGSLGLSSPWTALVFTECPEVDLPSVSPPSRLKPSQLDESELARLCVRTHRGRTSNARQWHAGCRI